MICSILLDPSLFIVSKPFCGVVLGVFMTIAKQSSCQRDRPVLLVRSWTRTGVAMGYAMIKGGIPGNGPSLHRKRCCFLQHAVTLSNRSGCCSHITSRSLSEGQAHQAPCLPLRPLRSSDSRQHGQEPVCPFRSRGPLNTVLEEMFNKVFPVFQEGTAPLKKSALRASLNLLPWKAALHSDSQQLASSPGI